MTPCSLRPSMTPRAAFEGLRDSVRSLVLAAIAALREAPADERSVLFAEPTLPRTGRLLER